MKRTFCDECQKNGGTVNYLRLDTGPNRYARIQFFNDDMGVIPDDLHPRKCLPGRVKELAEAIQKYLKEN